MKGQSVLQPIKSKILIELVEPSKEEVLDSGIILTTPDRDAANQAKVIAVGPEVEYVKVGDIIIPNWNAADPTEFEKQKYWFVKEDEVVMIIEE